MFIFENTSIRGIMTHPEGLPDVFAIADTETKDRSVRSVTVCLFDEVGVLYLVDSVDQKESDTYHLSVPYSDEFLNFCGILDKKAYLYYDGSFMIDGDALGNPKFGYKRHKCLINVGPKKVYPQMKYHSTKVTETLKEIMTTRPMKYHFGRPKNRLDDFFVGFDPKQISVKSEIVAPLDKIFRRELNVFPIVLQLAEERENILFDDITGLFMNIMDASVGVSFLVASFFNEDERTQYAETAEAIASTLGFIGTYLTLKNLSLISYKLFDARYGTFCRCISALDKMLERNRVLSEGFETQ